MADQDTTEPKQRFFKLTLAEFAGDGVMVSEAGVVMAFFTTTGPHIDVTMTKAQAKVLTDRLAAAAK